MRNETVRLTVVLLLICAIGTGAVAFVNEMTKDTIAQINAEIEAQARKDVMPAAPAQDSYVITKVSDEEFARAKAALDSGNPATLEAIYSVALASNGQPVGYALTVTGTQAFGGSIKVMVGIDVSGKITGVKVTEHAETPGLGAKASTEDKFVSQFTGKSTGTALEVVKDGTGSTGNSKVNAITAATITSRAVTAAVNCAGQALKGLQPAY